MDRNGLVVHDQVQRGAGDGPAAAAGVHRDTALTWWECGYSSLPPLEDGSKAPLADVWDEDRHKWTWTPYQRAPAGWEHVESWYADGRTGNGVATGVRGLELFEFDDRATYDRFRAAAVAFGLAELVERIEAGYLEETPGGGIHWFYVCERVRACCKLAERPIPGEEHKRKTLIEVKARGGFAVVAPSCGTVHPTGGAYRLLRGGPRSIATISDDERESLTALARTFDEVPAKLPTPPKAARRAPTGGYKAGRKVGDDFNARARIEVVVGPFGWELVHTSGDVQYWRRPGKDRGWSATWGYTKGFRVFTTSTSLEARSHSLFYVYCHLHHGGDWKACVKELAQQGYGTWVDDDGEEHPNPAPARPKGRPKGRPDDREAAARQQYPGYILGENETPVKCVSNTITWLSLRRPGWVRYDSFLRLVLLGGDPMTDHAVIELLTEIEASLGMGWPKSHVEDALIALGHRDTFSPLAQYLESLEWDEVNRLELFFIDHYEVEDTLYHREVGRVLFLSAVARGLDPGCKVDTVVLMMGRQDLHKSLGIAALCPRDEWFTDNIGDLDGGVETAKRLGGKWLVELSELSAMRKSEVETIKSFITTQVDNYRPSYGRANQDFPRSCIFIGTTNSDQPLQDLENRRFLPVKITNKGKLALIESNRDQLWAEAVHRYKQGERWWITSSDLVEEAKEQAETARAIDAWEDVLADRLQSQDRTTVPEAALLLRIEIDRLTKSDQTRIGNILRKIGFERDRETVPPRAWYYKRVSVPP
jgi:hypothetical protein